TAREALRAGAVPPPIASAIVIGVLRGLHAAHEATLPDGRPLAIVHRDVSPANVLIGADGVARLLDFGVAKANARLSETRTGVIKGKLSYMAPEQLAGGEVTRRVDIYATGAVLWELLAGVSLFGAKDTQAVLAARAKTYLPPSPAAHVTDLPPALTAV